MNTQQLVHMANRISAFFEHFKSSEKAMVAMAEHLQKFWEPRMRQQLWEHFQHHPDHGLTNLAERALVYLMNRS